MRSSSTGYCRNYARKQKDDSWLSRTGLGASPGYLQLGLNRNTYMPDRQPIWVVACSSGRAGPTTCRCFIMDRDM